MGGRTIRAAGGHWLFFGVILVLGLAFWLRFFPLDDRPMHADEATGARILSSQLEGQPYVFNPQHFHGPWPTVATSFLLRPTGATDWGDLSKRTIRAPTALAGFLTVLAAAFLPFCLRSRDSVPMMSMGRSAPPWSAGFWAAAFVGTSPLLVYYSGFFIHEPWLAFFGVLALLSLFRLLVCPRVGIAVMAGLFIGLMAAVRETFVLALVSWMFAGILLLWRTALENTADPLAQFRASARRMILPVVCLLGTVAFVTVMAYTGWGREPAGILRFLQSYFVYETTAGHEKAWFAYLHLLLWPKLAAGLGWTEIGVLFVALAGYFAKGPGWVWRRFLVDSAGLQFFVYSMIAYKTPWLIALPWAQLCLAAGLGAAEWVRNWPKVRAICLAVFLTVLLCWQATQAYRAVFVLPSDARNPYAYVPTAPDLERAVSWLESMALEQPERFESPPAVIGTDYWPLPWYLRNLGPVGYYTESPPDLEQRPLVIFVSKAALEREAKIETTHILLPRGLRHEVPIFVCIRRDLWTVWNSDAQ